MVMVTQHSVFQIIFYKLMHAAVLYSVKLYIFVPLSVMDGREPFFCF